MINEDSRALDWNDSIENDSSFELLPEGDYEFEVKKFERARHNGSDKMPPCNKAVLTIEVSSDQLSSTITHNLFLHTKTEGMLCAFFTGIGQRKHGEKLSMDWNKVVGSSGRCKVGIREWTGDDGTKRQFNQITKFYDPDASAASPGTGKTFKEGLF